MTRIAVVTDSSAYLPAGLVTRHHIHVVSLYVHLRDSAFRDGVDLNAAAPAEVEKMRAELQRRYAPAELLLCELSPVVASHVGPGTVALAFYQE